LGDDCGGDCRPPGRLGRRVAEARGRQSGGAHRPRSREAAHVDTADLRPRQTIGGVEMISKPRLIEGPPERQSRLSAASLRGTRRTADAIPRVRKGLREPTAAPCKKPRPPTLMV